MAAPCLADYMEAIARKQKCEVPEGYGYKADLAMGVGFYLEAKTGCLVLEKPIIIPSGKPYFQGYMVLFTYTSKEGVELMLQGGLPPQMPATSKEPGAFESKEAIANNFGIKEPGTEAAKKNSDYCTAVRVPVELCHKVEVEGRDIWMVRFDQDVVTPFLQAAKEGNAEKVSKILQSGEVDGSVVDEDGVSPLQMAAFVGSVETCKALMSKGSDVNYQEPKSSRTPLMFAAQGGHTDVVKLLREAGADVAKADSEGQTALMFAALAGKADTCKYLASCGAKDAKNGEGMTALAIAEGIGHAEAVAVLKAA
mmetsp:Transcript_11216/g.25173  ORF Transcript_11216/g.25173 Transcript_11216/m.25173 type:complete len:310 (-) Transcript_11216:110-1039(-)